MITVTLYSYPDTQAAEGIRNDLAALREQYPHQLLDVDISNDEVLKELYGAFLPVLAIGPYKLKGAVTRQEIQVALGAAIDRVDHWSRVNSDEYQRRLDRGRTITGIDRFYQWLSHHYMAAINTFLAFFVLIPFSEQRQWSYFQL